MDMIHQIRDFTIPAAYALLPPAMASSKATAMLIAIGLQESRFIHRRQVSGPARGFWQFERDGGVMGVATHRKTAVLLAEVLRALRYEPLIGKAAGMHTAIEHNDVLACVFARLLLWTVPARLPERGEGQEAWRQYLEGWRPGKPHPATWASHFLDAWDLAEVVPVTETPL